MKRPATWYNRSMKFLTRSTKERSTHRINRREETFRELFDNAEAVDNGVLGEYARDERDSVLFEGLRYFPERKEWRARFVPTHPETESDPSPIDLTYAMVEAAHSLTHDGNIKPSQSLKALAAFHRQFDIEAAKLKFD